jgi:putative peptide zinc metalloprotease protein
MRRALTLLAALAAILLLAVPAQAIRDRGNAPNNVVDASPTTDGVSIKKARVAVYTARGDTVDSTNLAQANPHDCTGCEGIAAAFQAVIVVGKPTTFKPENLAVAVNINCHSCGAFAYAYQYVIQVDSRGRLSGDARDNIEEVEQQADDLVRAGLPYADLDARLQQLAERFKTIVRTDLERAGDRPHGGRDEEHQDEHPPS